MEFCWVYSNYLSLWDSILSNQGENVVYFLIQWSKGKISLIENKINTLKFNLIKLKKVLN